MADYTFQDAIDELERVKCDRADLSTALQELLSCSTLGSCDRKDAARSTARLLLSRLEKGERL